MFWMCSAATHTVCDVLTLKMLKDRFTFFTSFLRRFFFKYSHIYMHIERVFGRYNLSSFTRTKKSKQQSLFCVKSAIAKSSGILPKWVFFIQKFQLCILAELQWKDSNRKGFTKKIPAGFVYIRLQKPHIDLCIYSQRKNCGLCPLSPPKLQWAKPCTYGI